MLFSSVGKSVCTTKNINVGSIRTYMNLQKVLPRTLTPKVPNVSQRRWKFSFFEKPSPEKYKIIDNLPSEYNMIYRNTMHRYLVAGQIISGIAGIAALFTAWKADVDTKINFNWEKKPRNVDNELTIYLAATIGFCVAIQSMIYKMPIRIYNLAKQEKYVLIFYRSVPLMTRRVTCKTQEVEKLEESGILPWKDSRYVIKNNQKVILIENFFRRPADLSIMLGYHKNDED